jgi:hypothetical protein
LLRKIDERWPGVDLRIACNRYLAANPGDKEVLARELEVTASDLTRWLRDDKSVYATGLSSHTLKTLEKYNKSKKNKKRGRPPGESSGSVERIKEYGVEQYVQVILDKRRAAISAAARARLLT